MLNEYRAEINKMVNTCDDAELLDLIFKILVKEDKQ